MAYVQEPVELVHVVRQGITTCNHGRQHPKDAKVTIFNFTKFQAYSNQSGGKGTAGQAFERRPTDKTAGSIKQFLGHGNCITQMIQDSMGTVKTIGRYVRIQKEKGFPGLT
jgi:hypothetical protein